MEKRWVSIKLTLILLFLGVLPPLPDVPLPFAFALMALALLATVPLMVRFTRAVVPRLIAPVQCPTVRAATADSWQLLRPVAPGMPGTVRSRAPSGLIAAHG